MLVYSLLEENNKRKVYICLRVMIICGYMLRAIKLGRGHFQKGGYELQLGIWPPETSTKPFPRPLTCKDYALSRSVCYQSLVIRGEPLARAAGQNSLSHINKYVTIFGATHKSLLCHWWGRRNSKGLSSQPHSASQTYLELPWLFNHQLVRPLTCLPSGLFPRALLILAHL